MTRTARFLAIVKVPDVRSGKEDLGTRFTVTNNNWFSHTATDYRHCQRLKVAAVVISQLWHTAVGTDLLF